MFRRFRSLRTLAQVSNAPSLLRPDVARVRRRDLGLPRHLFPAPGLFSWVRLQLEIPTCVELTFTGRESVDNQPRPSVRREPEELSRVKVKEKTHAQE